MYDINHNGLITSDEMLQFFRAVHKMIGQDVEFAEDEDTPEKVRSDQVCSYAGMCADKRTWVACGYLASRQDLQEHGQGSERQTHV